MTQLFSRMDIVDTLQLYVELPCEFLLQKDYSLLKNSINRIRFFSVLFSIKVNVSLLPFKRFIMLTIEVVHLIVYHIICVENVNRC